VKWIAFEDLPSSSNRFLLRRRQFIEVTPEFFDRAILVAHASGGVSFNAVSIETKRPLSKSSSASIKSSGMLVDVASRMRSTRRWRSALGNASISFRISVPRSLSQLNHSSSGQQQTQICDCPLQSARPKYSCSCNAIGTLPLFQTKSWKARRLNLSPCCIRASARNFRICNFPI
jgi:hypothetical protein